MRTISWKVQEAQAAILEYGRFRNRSADYARNSIGMKFTRRYEIRIEFHRDGLMVA